MDTIYSLDMEIRYREIIVKDRLIYLFYKSITLPVVLGPESPGVSFVSVQKMTNC